MASKAKRGKQPKMVVKRETLGAELTDDFLPDDEPEAAKLGVAKAPLNWQQQTDADGQPAKLWAAKRPDGTIYNVEEDERDWRADPPDTSRAWFCEVDGEDLGEPQPTLEAAQALCQWHADTELMWEAIGPCYVALPYHCDPAPDGGWGAWFGDELIDDTAESSDEAQHVCQEHHREQHPPSQAESAAPPEPAATSGQLPPPQRADWVIPMPLTDEEMIEAFEEGRKLRRKRRRLQNEVAASAERHKNLVARNRELIGKLEDEIEALDEHMPEKAVDCFRAYVRDGDEIWVRYSSPDDGTETLHERRLEQWEQRQLFGEGDPPADKPPPPATEPPPDDDPPSVERGAPTEPPPATEPHPDPEMEPLTWRKITVEDDAGKRTVYVSGDPEGEHYRLDRVPQKAGGDGLWHVLLFVAPGRCLPLPGQHTTLKAAKAEASRHNNTRLRWETPPDGWGELLESSGRYQLRRLGDDRVKGQYIGPDESRDLGVQDDLWAAQVACQEDADQRRAEG